MGTLRGALIAVLVAAGAALGGCGGDDAGSTGGADTVEAPLVVSAAASLNGAFEAYGKQLDPEPRFSFAGSDELAAQIRQGAAPDVFAAANTTLPDALFEEKVVYKPTVFARNKLVLAVPAADPKVDDLEGLTKKGVAIAIGSESGPVGSYTRDVLGRLPPKQSKAILANVRSEEPDVKGVVGKLIQGAVDAGFVYRSDVAATDGQLTAIELPARLKPQAAYGVAVVREAKNPKRAREFIDGLLKGAGAQELRAAGFDPPPGT